MSLDRIFKSVGQPKPNLRRKRKALDGLRGLLEIIGLEVIAEGVRAGTQSEC